MRIPEEDIPQLEQWITHKAAQFRVDCDKDIFAEYTLSIVQNNFNFKQLKKFMFNDLKPFLRKNTNTFVKEFFVVLQSKNYQQGVQTLGSIVDTPNRFSDKDYFHYLKPEILQNSKRAKISTNLKPDKIIKVPYDKKKAKDLKIKNKTKARKLRDAAKPKTYTLKEKLEQVISEQPYPKADTLIVANIPEDRLHEKALCDYFSKFAEIEYINIEFDLRYARVKFATEAGARLAWSSPIPIFDNRFIKLYYAKEKDVSQLSIEELSRKQEFLAAKYELKQHKRSEFAKKTLEYISKKERLMSNYLRLIKALEQQIKDGEDPGKIKKEIENYKQQAVKYGYAPEIFLKEKERLQNKIKVIRGEKVAFTKPREPQIEQLIRKNTLDNRSKHVLVTPIKEEVEEEFKKNIIGDKFSTEITRVGIDSVKLLFDSRAAAEKFVSIEDSLQNIPLEKFFIIHSQDDVD